jgi:hypothetical protein
MNYEETYIVEVKHADGTIDAEPWTDVADALRAYKIAADDCGKGETVKLHRTSSVVLASKVRA